MPLLSCLLYLVVLPATKLIEPSGNSFGPGIARLSLQLSIPLAGRFPRLMHWCSPSPYFQVGFASCTEVEGGANVRLDLFDQLPGHGRRFIQPNHSQLQYPEPWLDRCQPPLLCPGEPGGKGSKSPTEPAGYPTQIITKVGGTCSQGSFQVKLGVVSC